MDRPDVAVLDERLALKKCPDPYKGLGVFARKDLSTGLRLMIEAPFFVYESCEEASENIEHDFPRLPATDQAIFTRLFAGFCDLAPIIRLLNHDASAAAVGPARLRNIVRCNRIEGQGIGCVVPFYLSALNHSCVPNAWVYWNETHRALTLHTVRDIAQGEEVTISYFQESVYLNHFQRNDRLED
ncbi:hypothetical protein Hte_001898 [Hypoxylon texense]